MTGESGRLTSELLWRSTVIAVLLDVPLLYLINRLVQLVQFRRLVWYLAAAAFLIYAALWGGFASAYFWTSVYRAVFPEWSRWLLPFGFGILYGLFAMLFWWMSMKTPRWHAVWFVLLGGLVSLVGHGIGISRGLLRVPLLSDASAASALVFGVFEFIFYWCLIVALASAGRSIVARGRGRDA